MHSYQYEILLTKKEYETISADFGNEAKRVLQIDFFYDTPELFLDRPPESSGNIPMSVKEQGTTVRIRHREGVLQGTILQQQARADLPYPNETCFTVERLPLTLDYNGKTLRLCAQLITERLQITPGAGIELLLDKNYYYGIVDYELTIAYEKTALYELQLLQERLAVLCGIAPYGRNRWSCGVGAAAPDSMCKSDRLFAGLVEKVNATVK